MCPACVSELYPKEKVPHDIKLVPVGESLEYPSDLDQQIDSHYTVIGTAVGGTVVDFNHGREVRVTELKAVEGVTRRFPSKNSNGEPITVLVEPISIQDLIAWNNQE
jgi:hypothetical protein